MGRLENAVRRAADEQGASTVVDLPATEQHSVEEFPSEAVTPATEERAPAAAATEIAATQELTVPDAVPVPVTDPSTSEQALRRQVSAALATKTVVDETMMPASREQYRRLAAALHQAQRTTGLKVVMIASAVAGEGKTLTVSNLSMTLSESYRRDVLLVDGDLRRPSLHMVFQVPGEPGLSDGLVTSGDPKLPLHRVSERLSILPAGRATSDPIGALTSERMRRLVMEAREVFDWVIIDTPPVGLLTDAALLASMADGVILVVKAASTSHDMVNRAVDLIGRDRVLGVVLNQAMETPNRSSYDYSRYYYDGPQLPPGRE